MGIYLPNMEMPRSCSDCPVAHPALGNLGAAILGCPLIGKTLSAPFCEKKRMDNCPLVSVPPHGDLIDTSEKIRVQLYDDMTEDFHMIEMTIDDLLSQGWVEAVAPTIIPADPAEEGETCILM